MINIPIRRGVGRTLRLPSGNEAKEEAIASSHLPYRKRLEIVGGQRDKSLFHLTGVRFLKSEPEARKGASRRLERASD